MTRPARQRFSSRSHFPALLEPHRLAEKALTAVVQEACVHGVSTRSVDELVKAMGMTGISKSRVSRLCEEIDEKVKASLCRPLKATGPICGSTRPAAKVLHASWQRCRVHFMRSVLAHAGRQGRRVVAA
jgi:transposase-like protein